MTNRSGTPFRRRVGIPQSARIIGLVGQIQPIKGHAQFVKAGIKLADEFKDLHFLIVGEPPRSVSDIEFDAGLKSQIAASGFGQRFHFTGFQDDIAPVMSAIDILTVPSWNEPFGRVAVEGMAAGCAVIGTRAGGLMEIITNEDNGLLVEPKDAEALCVGIRRLVDDPQLRKELGEQAQQSVNRFSVESHVEQMQRAYEAVLAET